MSIDVYDILIIVGILFLSIGLWLYNPAVSLCVIGIVLLFLGLGGANKAKKGGES